jgi:hypothetical protein
MTAIRNIDRFRSDLETLLKSSEDLQLALFVKTHGAAEIAKTLKKNGMSEEMLKNLPAFNVSYEAWYSEALTVIKQLLPDRLQDFKEHYEAPRNRKEISFATYRIQDALKRLRVTRSPHDQVIVDDKAAIRHFQQQTAILRAAEKRFESSLFEMRQLVQADLFDSEIGAARELLKNKFLRAAGAVAGVVLEKHLRQVCDDHGLKIPKKNPALSDLNESLKANLVIDIPQWRFISMLADIRNLCDHSKNNEPTAQQVIDFVDGTEKTLKIIF